MGSSKPQPPAAPDVGESTAEGIQAYVENLPQILQTMAKYQPLLQESTAMGGAEAFNRALRESGGDIARAMYAIERDYGPEFARQNIANMRAAAPRYFDVRDQYGDIVKEDLGRGGELSDEQRRTVQQATRGGQSARGTIRGRAPVAEEAMRTFLASDAMRDKRLGRAYQYMTSPTPGVSAGAAPGPMGVITGAAGGQSPMLSPSQGMAYGQQGAQMAQQQYGQAYGNYQNQMANYRSPWSTALGLGMAGLGAAGGMGFSPFSKGGIMGGWSG